MLLEAMAFGANSLPNATPSDSSAAWRAALERTIGSFIIFNSNFEIRRFGFGLLRHLIGKTGNVGDFQISGADRISGPADDPKSSVPGGGQIANQAVGCRIDQVVNRDCGGGKTQ